MKFKLAVFEPWSIMDKAQKRVAVRSNSLFDTIVKLEALYIINGGHWLIFQVILIIFCSFFPKQECEYIQFDVVFIGCTNLNSPLYLI